MGCKTTKVRLQTKGLSLMLRPYPIIALDGDQVLHVVLFLDGLMVGVPCTIAE